MSTNNDVSEQINAEYVKKLHREGNIVCSGCSWHDYMYGKDFCCYFCHSVSPFDYCSYWKKLEKQ